MIWFHLFWQFFKIGMVSFGGGYGMISLIRETVLTNNWLTEEEFITFIAIAESTPGPLAVNMATFIGASQDGILGALAATLGVVLPAFIIILILASSMQNLLKYTPVKSFLAAIRPCIAALVLGTGFIMGLQVLGDIKYIEDSFCLHYDKALIFLILSGTGIVARKINCRPLSPVIMIIISACLGVIVHSV